MGKTARGAALLVPAVAIIVLGFAYPLIRLLDISLGDGSFTLDYYRAFLSNSTYIRLLAKTFYITAMVTAACLCLAYPAAAAISRTPARWRNVLLGLVAFPYLTSPLVRVYAWTILLQDNGIVNDALRLAGLIDRPLPLIYNTAGMYIGMIQIMLPLMLFPIYTAMRNVDTRTIQASYAHGGGPLRTFVAIYLPQTMSGIRSGCVLVFVLTLGFYILPAALGGVGDIMISSFIATQVAGSLNFSTAAVAAMILLALTLMLVAMLGSDLPGVQRWAVAKPASARVRRALRGAASGAWRRTGLDTMMAHVARRGQSGRAGGSALTGILGGAALAVVTGLVLAFLIGPSLIVMVLSLSGGDFLEFPPSSWSLRWYQTFFSDQEWLAATELSFAIAFTSTGIALVAGTLASYALVRWHFPGRRLAYSVILAPLVVPSIVSAIGIYLAFAELGLLGTRVGLVIVHATGALSFVVVIVSAALSGVDRRLEMASMNLGFGPLQTFVRITLHLLAPAFVSAAMFSFLYSFDEVVITSFIAGVDVQTLPLRIWESIQHRIDPTIAAVSSMLLVLPIVGLAVLQSVQFGDRDRRADDTG